MSHVSPWTMKAIWRAGALAGPGAAWNGVRVGEGARAPDRFGGMF
jgi:hypothetical protein